MALDPSNSSSLEQLALKGLRAQQFSLYVPPPTVTTVTYLWRNLQLRHLETLKLDSEISVSKYDYIIVWLNASWSGSALSVPSHFLIVAKMSLPKRSASYWSNPPFLIFDIRALWRSILSARVPECQKLKLVG